MVRRRAVHWAVAALAVLVVALGWAMTGSPRGGYSCELLIFLRRSVGSLILAVMAFRVIWRLTHPPPPFPEDPLLARVGIAIHLTTQFVVYALVALHVAAALMPLRPAQPHSRPHAAPAPAGIAPGRGFA
jgi:cytochrome b561